VDEFEAVSRRFKAARPPFPSLNGNRFFWRRAFIGQTIHQSAARFFQGVTHLGMVAKKSIKTAFFDPRLPRLLATQAQT